MQTLYFSDFGASYALKIQNFLNIIFSITSALLISMYNFYRVSKLEISRFIVGNDHAHGFYSVVGRRY